MAGKKWTAERHAEDAARRANEAARKVQESGVTPSFQPDTDMTNGEVGRVKTKNPQHSSLDEIEAMSDERSGMQRPEPEPEAPATEPAPSPEPNAAAEPNVPEASTPPPTSEVSAAAPEAAPVATPEPPKTVKQTVNGKEYDVPQAEIDEAGSERLWRIQRANLDQLEANKAALAETRRMQAQIAQQQAQQAQPQQPQYSKAQLLEYVRSGTPEQAAAAWDILEKGLTVDRAGITNEAAFKANQRGAIDRFQAEFQDVLANPHMARLAAVYENERIAKGLHEAGLLQWNGSQFAVNWGDPRIAAFDFSKIYRSMGNELRTSLPRQSQPPANPGTTTGNPSQPSDKEARKASIVTLPTAATPRASQPAEDKPQSRSEILAEEAKARGKIAPHG